jgi:predicted DNA-binding protein
MSRKRSKIPADAIVVPLRVPGDMQKKIRNLSEKSRLSDADIMRLAIERGLGRVEEMFQIAETAAA